MSLHLQTLLSQERDPKQAVAVIGAEVLCWSDFVAQVCHKAAILKARPESRWAMYFECSSDFAIHLFAVWLSGGRAIIVGDNLAITQANVQADVDGFLGDFPELTSNSDIEPKTKLNSKSSEWSQEAKWPGSMAIEADPESEIATVFTTGTTGAPSKIALCFRQLENELSSLEQLFGEQIQDSAILSTASHQHLYGLLFRVLWPLAAGRMFQAKSISYIEELQEGVDLYPRYSFVTTPSHLGRLPDSIDWPELASRVRAVFSSTAPLAIAASEDATEKFCCPVTEIYGSSETGGIAWRQQLAHESWSPLPGLTIDIDAQDQTLKLCSPLSFSTQWQTTADRIKLMGDGRFILLGRLDRIVKVEGKRVSLTGMESRLKDHSWVDDARLLLIQGRRVELAAVVVLSDSAQQKFDPAKKRAINVELRAHLQEQFELPVLPRRWRYVEAIPVNAQGKTSEQSLLSLF